MPADTASSALKPKPIVRLPPVAPQLVAPPETPSRSANGLNAFLLDFGKCFDIHLPIGHGILKKIRLLYFQQRHLLEDTFAELTARHPPVKDLTDRLLILDERLRAVATLALTPHSTLRRPASPSKVGPGDRYDDAPPSPTLAVKHAPSQRSEKVVAPITTPMASRLAAPSSAPPKSVGASIAPTKSVASMVPPKSVEPLVGPAKSAATSFATTVNTSFGSTITSSSKGTQTTIGTSFDGTQETDLFQSSGRWGPEVERALPALFTAPAITPPLRLADDLNPPIAPQTGSEHHRVARIPRDGLAPIDIPESLASLPFSLVTESYRVMRFIDMSPHGFESQWMAPKKTFQSLWKFRDKYMTKRTGRRFLDGIETDYKGHTLSARLRWSKARPGSVEPLFDLDLRAPRKEHTNAVQPKFGDRILVVDLPDFENPPEVLKGQDILPRMLELLSREQQFLGRTWLRFHVKRRKGPGLDPDEASTFQATFVALKGPGLPDLDFVYFINFAIPLCEPSNLKQPACKAYSRIDLTMSRTRPVYTFAVEDIQWIRDELSDDQPDNDTFDDPLLDFPRRPAGLKRSEMTDGCGEVSLEVMQIVQRELSLTYLPAVIQARIAHSKGLWLYMPDSPPGKWIKIRDSQRKLVRADMGVEPEWRTLNINGHSGPARSSILYTGFIPILRDRGVSPHAILEIARQQIDMEGKEFLDALDDALALERWIFVQKDVMAARRLKGGIPELAGFPVSSDERILSMLESGFKPTKCAYLRKQVLDVADHVFTLMAKRFKIRLPRSTSLLGVPDPTGMLKPGEVHIVLSQPLKDPATGQIWSSLHGLDLLIARNPSIRNADIQKITCVYRPELAHLHDVVVFSVHGPRPLASKLSGGDYDGDTFWVCWETALVEPFVNAPAPWELRAPEAFGIVKDIVTLAEVLGTGSPAHGPPTDAAVRNWIRRSTAARMQDSMLPTVTLFHNRLTYADEDISSERADHLADLHDLLVDADKQGYLYTQADFDEWRRQRAIPLGLPKPACWKFTRKSGKGAAEATETPKPADCVDDMFFNEIVPRSRKILDSARLATRDAKWFDSDLTALFDDVVKSPNPTIQKALQDLNAAFTVLQDEWLRGTASYSKSHDRMEWAEMTLSCRDIYVSIAPSQELLENDTIIEWMRRLGNGPAMWENLRLSALAKRQRTTTDGSLVFTIAGGELCHLKAQSLDRTRTIRLDAYVWSKPQKRGDWLEEVGEVQEEDDSEGDETFYEGASAIDGIDLDNLIASTAAATPMSRKRQSSTERNPVKRRQSETSSPTRTRGKGKRMQPRTPLTGGRVPKGASEEPVQADMRGPEQVDDYDLHGTPPPHVTLRSQRPAWMKSRD
ncbi:hypothetical protein LTR53_012332 [Teratosphaeriaceae sp. CCFEE 6253]|nr:hypothetical protein LTR53_012332 [Teratosphaeriaceae sp. CCFEE 6253]